MILAAGCGREMPPTPQVRGLHAHYASPQEADPIPLATWFAHWQTEELAALIERATDHSFELRAAVARMRQARARARLAGSTRWPSVQAEVGASRSRISTVDIGRALDPSAAGGGASPTAGLAGGDLPETTVIEETWHTSLSASYEIDLWGRLADEQQAAGFAAEASAEQVAALRVSLAGRIAETWLTAIAARESLELAEEMERSAGRLLALQRVRYARGRTTATAVHAAAATREQAAIQISDLRTRLEQTRHALALLVGLDPGELVLQTTSLPSVPDLPDSGVPADLLRRRPDVRAAIRDVAAANRRLAARLADRWPRVQLEAAVFDRADQPGGLLEQLLWRIAGAISHVFFDGGRRQARIDFARADEQEALAGFGQVLLQALADVEDALVANRDSADALRSADRRADRQAASLEAHHRRYAHGLEPAPSVLEARIAKLRAHMHQLARRRDLLIGRVSLYRALGGDWRLPEERR
ncbi:MAG: TolC family protein [Planctomycetota bacterium]